MNKHYKEYINRTFKVIIFMIFIILTINLVVDPGKIYLKKIVSEYKAHKYIKRLINSKNGLVIDGWNERLIKTTFAKEAGLYECIILGSSHIKQISFIKNIGGIQKQCKSLINLGVSGGSLEDIFILSYFIFKNENLPKKIFIDIDPWTLKFNMDSRYGAYMNEYNKMNKILGIKYENKIITYTEKIVKNLINWEYFYTSLKILKNKKLKIFDYFSNKNIEEPKKPYIYSKGYEKSLNLPDGAHIYSRSYIDKQAKLNPNIPIGGGNYKINGKAYDILAITNLEKLLKLYKIKGVEVYFILTPYHPNVFKKGMTKSVKHMKEVEKVITEISKKYDIKIFGSFIPGQIGCNKNEFLDFMHPKIECLDKIDFTNRK